MDERKGHTRRLPEWNYATPAAYFVTFKVAGRRALLGSVAGTEVMLSPAGRIVEESWDHLPASFPVRLDCRVIMPDHVHAVLHLRPPEDQVAAGGAPGGWRPMMTEPTVVLGKVVRAWKARSTRLIRLEGVAAFGWQSRYFERVLRNSAELQRARSYILDNPRRWSERRHPWP